MNYPVANTTIDRGKRERVWKASEVRFLHETVGCNTPSCRRDDTARTNSN